MTKFGETRKMYALLKKCNPLYDQFWRDEKNVCVVKKEELIKETGSLIVAAEDEAITEIFLTKYIEKWVRKKL